MIRIWPYQEFHIGALALIIIIIFAVWLVVSVGVFLSSFGRFYTIEYNLMGVISLQKYYQNTEFFQVAKQGLVTRRNLVGLTIFNWAGPIDQINRKPKDQIFNHKTEKFVKSIKPYDQIPLQQSWIWSKPVLFLMSFRNRLISNFRLRPVWTKPWPELWTKSKNSKKLQKLRATNKKIKNLWNFKTFL